MVSEKASSVWAPTVLLSDGWAQNTLIDIDSQGNIVALKSSVEPKDCDIIQGTVVPGMTNLHSHAHQRAMAGLAEKQSTHNDSFWSWREVMYQYLERIEADDIYAIASQLYLEMLKFGYTGVGEFQYLHHDPNGKRYQDPAEITRQCLQAAKSSGIAFTALPVLYQYGGFNCQPASPAQKRFLNTADEFLMLVDALANEITNSTNCSLGIAPHSLRAVSEPLLQQIIEQCEHAQCIHIHVAEQQKEVDDCLNWSSQRPVEWLLQHFDVDSKWCLIHATHMTEAETTMVANSGAVAGLCPTTEANLGDGLFNAKQYIDQQGIWGIGSDSHISISPVEELRWLEYGQRLSSHQRNVLSTNKVTSTGRFLYQQALNGGAQACARLTGKIKPGFRADFIVLDENHPRMYGRKQNDLIDSWLFSGNENPVKDVYVGGNKVITDGHHQDEEKIIANFQSVIRQLTG